MRRRQQLLLLLVPLTRLFVTLSMLLLLVCRAGGGGRPLLLGFGFVRSHGNGVCVRRRQLRMMASDGREGIAAHERAMASFRIEDALLHEDADIVVVDKPPGALCVPGRYIKDSLVVRVADYFSIQVGALCFCLALP
jgi:hypothetical protein